jgi:hypothetical protein
MPPGEEPLSSPSRSLCISSTSSEDDDSDDLPSPPHPPRPPPLPLPPVLLRSPPRRRRLGVQRPQYPALEFRHPPRIFVVVVSFVFAVRHRDGAPPATFAAALPRRSPPEQLEEAPGRRHEDVRHGVPVARRPAAVVVGRGGRRRRAAVNGADGNPPTIAAAATVVAIDFRRRRQARDQVGEDVPRLHGEFPRGAEHEGGRRRRAAAAASSAPRPSPTTTASIRLLHLSKSLLHYHL